MSPAELPLRDIHLPPAPSWYAGKMLECGATPSIPKGHDCLIVGVRPDGIIAEPLNPIRRCTPLSIANHSLHENASPCIHVEPGGILDTILKRLATYIEKNVKLKGQVKSAMVYPIAVMVIAGLVVGVILWKVIPTFANLFSGLGAELPMPTRVVIWASNALVKYIVVIIPAIAFLTTIPLYVMAILSPNLTTTFFARGK